MSSENIYLIDFLNSVPPPLILALLQLAPCISIIRNIIQISTWSAKSWKHSWLALAAWWATCLLLDKILQLLPLVVFCYVVILQWHQRRRTGKSPLTETTLQSAVTDLTIIQSSLPTSLHTPLRSTTQAFRATCILTVPYLILSFFISFRVVCAIAGTVLLLWRAPWAIVLCATVWRSAWFRWAVYKVWSFLINEPLPPPVLSPQPTINSTEAVNSIRFLFTIYENQRWWMGLDWTAALLPQERPSWCSASQQPMPPPDAFTLPESNIIYFPDGKGGRLKRTTTWRWEEPEWRVLIHKDGETVNRVERTLPSLKDENNNNSLLFKAAGLLRDSQSEINKMAGKSDEFTSEDLCESAENDVLTDRDGWVYGDNKWENQSIKGGMGKYTRFRRWTRIAMVFEIVEPVSPGDIGIEGKELALPPVQPTLEATEQQSEAMLIENTMDSPLRQRLKNALNTPPLG